MKRSVSYLILALQLLSGSVSVWAQDEFNPANPAEPNASSIKYRLSVRVEPQDAGSASGAGLYVAGTNASVRTSASSGYVLDHWTLNGVTYAQNGTSFTYTTRAQVDELVAHYRYDPQSPAEPNVSHTYRLYLTTNEEGACSFNITSGQKKLADSFVYLEAYPSTGYTFLGWYNGDELFCTDLAFNYQMPYASTTLEARVEFNPSNPAEPSYTEYVPQGEVTQTLNISTASHWSTCILPFSADIPAGVEAYTVTSVQDNVAYLIEAASFEAYTPYLVYSEDGYSGSLTGLADDDAYVERVVKGVAVCGSLRGAVRPQSVTSGYVLQNQGDGAKFYAISGATFVINRGKCWMVPEVPTAAAAIRFAFGQATALDNLAADDENAPIYTLQGQQVSTPVPGQLYIQNGKKFIVL